MAKPLRVRIFRWASLLTIALCISYGFGVLTIWLLMRLAGDRWWPATVLLFMPRWIWPAPALGLLALTLIFRRGWAWSPFAFGLTALFAISGFRLPFGRPPVGNQTFRIVTANMHGGQANGPVVNDFLEKSQPDIVAFQEYDPRTKIPYIRQPGWQMRQFSHMWLFSRWPVTVGKDARLLDDGEASELELKLQAEIWSIAVPFDVVTPAGNVRVLSLHLASPHQALGLMRHHTSWAIEMLKGNSARRGIELNNLRAEADDMGGQTILVGDFNTPSDSPIFRDAFSDYTDAFDSAGFGFGTSYAKHHTSLRIDHVLYADGWKCRRCYMSSDVGSGHSAVLAEMTR